MMNSDHMTGWAWVGMLGCVALLVLVVAIALWVVARGTPRRRRAG